MPTRESQLYALTRVIVSSVFDSFFRQEVYGQENLPLEGPFLLACNHVSYLDPPLLCYPIPRPVYSLTRKSLLQFKTSRWLFPRLNAIPIDREGADLGALRHALSVLKQGDPLLVFPEGTRTPNGRLQAGQPGIGLIACRSGAPVIPTRSFGVFEAWSRQKKFPSLHSVFTVLYGQPLTTADYDPGRKTEHRYAEAAQRIMDAISALRLPPPTVI